MKRLLCTAIASLLLAFLIAGRANSAVLVTIQPSADLGSIVWEVSWDSLAEWTQTSRDFNSMDPASGSGSAWRPWGTARSAVFIPDVGSPFKPIYDVSGTLAFGDGVGGVFSTPSGWGVSPDYDGSGNDDFFIFSTVLSGGGNLPEHGSFVLTIPGAYLANYNIGTYTVNPDVTIHVTDVPYRITEPGSLVLLGLGLAGLAFARRSKRAVN